MPLRHSVRISPVLLLVLAASACSKSETTPGATGYDGVKGTAIDLYDTGHGTPETLAQPKSTFTSIAAMVTTDGKTVSYPGTLDDKGQILIPKVPEGNYVLALEYPPTAKVPNGGDTYAYLEMSGREFDLGYPRSHRADLVSLQTPSTVSVSAALTKPWQRQTYDAMGMSIQPLDDALRIFSRSTSALGYTYASFGEDGAPVDNASALAGWKLDLHADSYSYDLPASSEYSAAKSDDLVLLHNVKTAVADTTLSADDPWSSYSFDATQEAMFASPFDLASGGTATIDGTFEAAPQKTLDLDFRGSKFKSVLADAPQLVPDRMSYTFDIYLEPGTPKPIVGADATLFELVAYPGPTYTNAACSGSYCDPTACPSGCDLGTATLPGDYTHSYSYGNPFDYGQELFSVYVSFSVVVSSLLTDTTTESVGGFLSYSFSTADVSGKPLEPFLGLATALTLNGQSLPTDKVTTGIGTTPTISFQPPTLGTPDFYLATVVQLDDQIGADGNAVTSSFVGRYRTSKTTFTLPDGILKSGKHYYVRLTAHQEDGYIAATPFQAPGTHSSDTCTFTGVFTP